MFAGAGTLVGIRHRLDEHYCTTTENGLLDTMEPLVAVTVTVYVPAGVLMTGGGGGVVWLLPPPHEGIKSRSTRTIATKIPREQGREAPITTTEKSKPKPVIQWAAKTRVPYHGTEGLCRLLAAGAVVVMVTPTLVVANLPVEAIEAGAKTQAAPAGSEEQDSAMVPLNPVELVTEMALIPEAPGAEMVTVVEPDGSAKKPG
jgi:hypothetical protein